MTGPLSFSEPTVPAMLWSFTTGEVVLSGTPLGEGLLLNGPGAVNPVLSVSSVMNRIDTAYAFIAMGGVEGFSSVSSSGFAWFGGDCSALSLTDRTLLADPELAAFVEGEDDETFKRRGVNIGKLLQHAMAKIKDLEACCAENRREIAALKGAR